MIIQYFKKVLLKLINSSNIMLSLGGFILWLGTIFITYRFIDILIERNIGQFSKLSLFLNTVGLHIILAALVIFLFNKVRKLFIDGASEITIIRLCLIFGIVFLSVVSFYTTYLGTKIVWSNTFDKSDELLRLFLSLGIQIILLAVALSFSFVIANRSKILWLTIIYFLVASVSIYFNFYFFYEQILGVTSIDEQRDTVKRDYRDFLNKARYNQKGTIDSLRAKLYNNKSEYQAKADFYNSFPDSLKINEINPIHEYLNIRNLLNLRMRELRALEPKFSQADTYLVIVDTVNIAILREIDDFFLRFRNELKSFFYVDLPEIGIKEKKIQHPFLSSIDFFFKGIIEGDINSYATKIAWISIILAIVVDGVILVAGFVANKILKSEDISDSNIILNKNSNSDESIFWETALFETFIPKDEFWKKYKPKVRREFALKLLHPFQNRKPISKETLDSIENDRNQLQLFNDFCKYGLIIRKTKKGDIYLNYNNPFLGDFMIEAV